MGERWRFNRFWVRFALFLCFLYWSQKLGVCWGVNSEGLALLRFRERVRSDPFGALANWRVNEGGDWPCSWFGVECSEGKVVILNLKDLRLKGTLGPELGSLIHVKSIILRNNSFSGLIPNEINGLKSLEVFDIRCNSFSRPLPSDFRSNPSLSILLLDHNSFFDNLSPELHGFSMLSKLYVDDKQLSTGVLGASHDGDSITWKIAEPDRATYRRMLQERDASSSTNSKFKLIPQRNRFKLEPVLLPLLSPAPAPSPSSLLLPFAPSPLPSANPVGHAPSSVPAPAPSYTSASTDQPNVSSPSPSTSPSRSGGLSSRSKHSAKWIILIGGLGASAVILISLAFSSVEAVRQLSSNHGPRD
ncbi:hypothetical protein Syun_016157 [Stephania yunnanensis]|uniref:Leucine-rich repeat-containing N-terminal plant-type domain-containing protein n=1 Tax=Stephania yunnanensis TaxID=152371 RepID=A0AAP0P3L8_9MAGN